MKNKERVQFNIRTTAKDRQAIDKLAKKLEVSRCEAIRIAVNAALTLKFTSGERVPLDLK